MENTIKFVKINSDDQMDEMHCSTCGRSIRKGIEINGILHGLDCGAKKLGWKETKKAQIENKALRIFNAVNYFKALYETSDKRTDSAAGILADLLGIEIKRDELGKLYGMVA